MLDQIEYAVHTLVVNNAGKQGMQGSICRGTERNKRGTPHRLDQLCLRVSPVVAVRCLAVDHGVVRDTQHPTIPQRFLASTTGSAQLSNEEVQEIGFKTSASDPMLRSEAVPILYLTHWLF